MTEQTITIATATRAVTLCLVNLRSVPWASHHRADFQPILQRALEPIHTAAGLFPNRMWPNTECNVHERLIYLGNQIISASSAIRQQARRRALRELRQVVALAQEISDELAVVPHYEPGNVPDRFEMLKNLAPGVYAEPAYRRPEGAQPDDLAEISHIPDLSEYNKQLPSVSRSINARGYALLRLPVLAWFKSVDNDALREDLTAAGAQIRHYYGTGWLLLDQLLLFYHPQTEDNQQQAANRRVQILGRATRRLARRNYRVFDVMDGVDNFSRTTRLHYCWLFDANIWTRLKRRSPHLGVEQLLLVPDSQNHDNQIRLPLRELRLQMEAQIRQRTMRLQRQRRELQTQISALNTNGGRVLSAEQRELSAEVEKTRQLVITLREEALDPQTSAQRLHELCDGAPANQRLLPSGGQLAAALADLRAGENELQRLTRNIDQVSGLRSELAQVEGEIEEITLNTTKEWRARYLPAAVQ